MPVPYYDWAAGHAAIRPDAMAQVDIQNGRHFTYAQMDERSARLARWLQDRGVGRGDRVAILAYNGPEFFELEFAAGKTGAVMVPLNWRLAQPELDYILGDCAPKVLIHDVEFAAMCDALRDSGTIPHGLTIDVENPDNPYDAALASAPPEPAIEALTHDDLAMIMYTSGTTGRPKGAMITHRMQLYNCINLGFSSRLSPDTIQLVVLPLFHTGGLNCYTNPVLHAGGQNIIMREFEPAAALDYIGDPALGITHFFGVPAHYQFMMQAPNFATADLSRLVMCGVGGASCPVPILEAWLDRGIPLVQGWGMTETSPAGLFLDIRDTRRKAGSAGKPVMHTEIRIVDDKGSDVAQGETGELLIRGPNVTPGYWNKPEATEAAFVDGFLKTGDAARMDEEGFVYIVDRWKDMYISGGENVYPAEVESVIYQLPQIAEAAVIGVPDERWGEVGKAVVVVKPGESLTDQELIAHCLANLARFKVPASVAWTDVLPRNATGKVLKWELRKDYVPAA
ncbi:MAG: long-chain fatty acid--CoA ligase [Rhodospirillaceae bacterium]|nr:long-chain fatty acid--CoA ligase [Rhodospirillaceae bacterium]MYB12365.1 long-chain fatty acid--CoA ligase [Rhodospirillaceae bacterium]MYI49001.1 long-chain fatty acid--CoA ligase [Rhodospirillaceae bacterium]